MTPVTPGKGRAVKRRWPTDDNPTDSEEEEHRQTTPVCKQCSQAIYTNDPSHFARHSASHLSFRPWKCSVCACTMTLKGNLQQHLNEQHQGNGQVIDNRTAEYYDALKAKAQANFPGRAKAIAKYIGGQKEALGFQDASDHEDDNAQDSRKISVCKECSNSIDSTEPSHLAQHSLTHLSFRPWKCSVCPCTMTRKGNLQTHLKTQHQGNGRVIDNRTAEYYDELEAKTKANFPGQSNAIAKYIVGLKEAMGFQGASDHEKDHPQDGRKIFVCKECTHSIDSTKTWNLVLHSLTHLSFRPWKCSVCTYTMARKGHLQQHLNEQHQGNGQVIDNRTAEYYDALKAKAQANFPDRSMAIAKLIGGQRHVSGIQARPDNEADIPQDNRPIVHLPAPDAKIRCRNAENRRLKQQNDQQAAQLKMLLEEVTALRDRIRNG